MIRLNIAIIAGLFAAQAASASPVLNLSAQADAYAIFGAVSANLGSNSQTLSYVASTGSLGGDATSNNTDITGVTHPNDSGSLLFVNDGTIGIRANNGDSSFKLEMPMLSTGFECVPAFMKADEPSRGVTAYVDIRVQSLSGTVAQYTINNSLSGIGTALVSNTTVTCPSSGLGTGALIFPLPSVYTDEYSAIIDIGYEIDGARVVSSGQFVTDGADGEPFSGNYEFTLAASLVVDTSSAPADSTVQRSTDSSTESTSDSSTDSTSTESSSSDSTSSSTSDSSNNGNNGNGVGGGNNNAGGNPNNNGNGPGSNNGNGSGGNSSP